MNLPDNHEYKERVLPIHEAPQPFSFGRNFFILVGNALLGIFLAGLLSAVFAVTQGYNISELANALSGFDKNASANFIRVILGLNQLFTFLVPGLLTAFILYKKDWLWNLFVCISPSTKNWVLGIIILLCATPMVQYSYFLNQQIPLPEYMLEQEEAAKELLSSIMTYEASYELFINLLLIAVLPGIGEEIVFRGILQKNLEWWAKNAHVAIWVSAIFFSTIHLQFAGFIPRMLLGAVLGYLFYYTQNLWVPIIAHIFNNGIQVLLDYFYKNEISSVDIENIETIPWYIGFISFIIVIGLLMYMKMINQNKLQAPLA